MTTLVTPSHATTQGVLVHDFPGHAHEEEPNLARVLSTRGTFGNAAGFEPARLCSDAIELCISS